MRKYGVGPSDTWKLDYHVSGPANADVKVLRDITDQIVAILMDEPKAKEVRTDVGNMTKRLVPDYDQARAHWATVTREDVARSTRVAYDGLNVGLYRQGDDLYPILLRHNENERRKAAEMSTLQVQQTYFPETVPLSQVTKAILLDWEEPFIVRWGRRRTVTVQATPNNTTYPDLKQATFGKITAIEMPPGYNIFLDGEDESTRDAQKSLLPGVIPAMAVIMLIVVVLYNAFRPIFIIFLTIPFIFIGVTPALIATGMPFGFLALLGMMSLSGMMSKNIIVLLDEIKLNIVSGQPHHEAIIEAGASRVRPISLGAATTILGVAPLLPDPFWQAMAVTIMAGLTIGTAMTLLLVPTLYAIFYRIPSPKQDKLK
ncbi:MAG: efflux RND transporter permease subunit [Amphritea sp.]